jgi:DNA-binding GntR family transcriptional regulator
MQKGRDQFRFGDEMLDPVSPGSNLVDAAAEKLRDLILLEKLPPGAAISERDVAAALGISRTPMRGAMAILEADGLIEYSATRRPRVADPSVDEIAEHLTVMGVLEALGGELACANATDAQISRIGELQKKIEKGSATLAPLEFFRTDMNMHRSIVEASGNGSLLETHDRYNARLWRARFVSSQRSAGRELTLAQHADIVTGLSARDARATARALRTHMTSAISNIKLAYRERAEAEGAAK